MWKERYVTMLVKEQITFLFSGELSLIGDLLLPGHARRNKSCAVRMRNAIRGNDLKQLHET